MTWAVGAQAEYQTPGAYRSDHRHATKSVAGVLSERHRRMLFEESGISPEVAAKRGYYTARREADVPQDRGELPEEPGLVVPMFSPDGITQSYQLRPDRKMTGPKYWSPADRPVIVDAHPLMLDEIRHGIGRLLMSEGAKTCDAATSRGVPTLMLPGVSMWSEPGVRPRKLRSCFDHVRLEGRPVFVAFDSDCMSKAEVQRELAELVRALEERGAAVKVIYLPDAPDGSKQGVDDYLAAGGTIKEMFMIAREFSPADIGNIRMSRNEKLRAGIGYLWRLWREGDWMHFKGGAERGNWARGHTAYNTMEALIELATSSGKVDERGIVVAAGLRKLAEMAGMSAPSVGNALRHLEADGQLEILPSEGRDKPRSYRLLVPRAALYSMERGSTGEGKLGERDPGCKGLRAPSAPRLRWSSPGTKVERLRGVVPGTSRVRETPRFSKGLTVRESMDEFPDRPYVKRLGPHRGAVLDALEAAGGELHIEDLCEVLHRSRPRDVRKRILPMLEAAQVIECEGDVVRLAADWLDKLEEERERKGEISQAEQQVKDHREQRARFRGYLEDAERSREKRAAGLAAMKRSQEKRAQHLAEHEAHQAKADAAELARRAAAKRYVFDQVKSRAEAGLPPIRLELLQQIMFDDDRTPAYAVPAARSLGCTIGRLPEFGNREFVIPPIEWRAAG